MFMSTTDDRDQRLKKNFFASILMGRSGNRKQDFFFLGLRLLQRYILNLRTSLIEPLHVKKALIADGHCNGSGEAAHLCSLARAFAVCSHNTGK